MSGDCNPEVNDLLKQSLENAYCKGHAAGRSLGQSETLVYVVTRLSMGRGFAGGLDIEGIFSTPEAATAHIDAKDSVKDYYHFRINTWILGGGQLH